MMPPTPETPDDSQLSHRRTNQLPPSARDPGAPGLASETWVRRIWFKRIGLTAAVLALIFIIATITTAISLRHALRASLPQLDGNLPVPGLTAPVTITRDPQGVPSIHAPNLDDLLFAQGYITASDRLFQMDALRRHGAGELAELLGPSLIEHDREQRILQLRTAADRAAAILAPDQLHQLQAYARGVNAFIATHSKTPSHPDTLAVEFHILHYTPAPWTPRDSLLIALVMSQDLSTEFPTKLNREALATHLPASLLPDLYPTTSWRDHPPTQTPADLSAPTAPIQQIPLDNTQSSVTPHTSVTPNNGCPIHDEASSRHKWVGDNPGCPMHDVASSRHGWGDDTYHHPDSRLVPHLRDGSIVAKVGSTISNRAPATPQDLLAVSNSLRAGLAIITNPTPAVRAGLCADCIDGSNNWAVAGTHTATGAPLLSNDMHLGLSAPDIWYEASLHADGATPLDVTGFTLPGVPFVIVGRNANVAWAFTNSGADVQDVLIEHFRGSGNTTEYEHPDHTWSPVGHQLEHIHVRAGRDVTLDVLTTTHTIGATSITTPIISPLYKSEHRPLALAWTIYDPSTITSPMYAINTATDAASLVAAFAGFGSVSQNLLYADAHHIGYHLIGRIPIRGPATQHPRPVAPFILPDRTPSDDDTDESGDNQSSLATPPSPIPGAPSSTRGLTARQGGLSFAVANDRTPPYTPSYRPALTSRSADTPAFALAGITKNLSSRPERSAVKRPAAPNQLSPSAQDLSEAQRSRRSPKNPIPPTPSTPSVTNPAPNLTTAPTAAYTIGSPIPTLPIDALDTTLAWSGYIPYDALPSVLDPASGILATANARIVTDDYPYFIANDWADPYRVERINHLLETKPILTPADMLRIQTDVHSEFDLLIAQRLAYALDHSAITKKDPRLLQAANLLRDWNGDLTIDSTAANIVASARGMLWTMLLTPHLHETDPRTRRRIKLSPSAQDLYTWGEHDSALEQLLQHTPARWLPPAFPNWNDFLTTAVQRGFKIDDAPTNLSTWTYGKLHPVDIAHPVFGSHSPISTLLGTATGSGFHARGGDGTTINAAGTTFGPSERFTADLSNPDNTLANITTGESGNPSSPWFLDQFLPWLNGTTFTLPLSHPQTTHTLILTPQ